MSNPKLSRRTFIRLSLLGGIGAGLAIIKYKTSEFGMLNFLRWSLRGELQRIIPPAVVGLEKCSSYDDELVSKLRNLWRISEMPDISGKTILVKPNLLDQVDGNLATTSPIVVGAVLDLLVEMHVGNLVVADGSSFRRDTYSIVKSCGLSKVLDERSIPFIDLNYDELIPAQIRDGWFRNINNLWLPRHVSEADYILSIPKLKTHHWAGVTLSLKNLLGIIPGSRYGWPKNIIHMNGINATILGLYQSLPPVFAISDGIIGMEGNGPLFGKPIFHGLLAAGKDPVAVDIICAQLMGFNIDAIPHLAGAAWAGIGQSRRIETRGAPPEELQKQYEPPPTL
jgi:uncharacterized protein (DUF362 family)